MRYFCCDNDRRRNEIAQRSDLNGIDFLEVLDQPSLPLDQRQKRLFVHFIHDPTGLNLTVANLRIEGGVRIQNISVVQVQTGPDPENANLTPVLIVEVDQAGDFSIYTLRLVEDPASPASLNAIDPILRSVDFSFKINCNTDLASTDDCQQSQPCEPPLHSEPTIDYLARDYISLRQLMLDRLSVLLPQWQERNPADLGVMLVEALAYVGDYLSYQQDAIATEAYLSTCHHRISARRHARLVDYFMHDGCNARTWVQVRIQAGSSITLPSQTQLLSSLPDLPPQIEPNSLEYDRAIGAGAIVFETMHAMPLFPEHNQIEFYTWGARECCLPKGATRATLRGSFPNLRAGMVLIFQEIRSPRTGESEDAELSHRHAVRLLEVQAGVDPIGRRFDREPSDQPLPVTEIRWGSEDALPFPVCISAEIDDREGRAYVEPISVALGNLVLADHGRTIGRAAAEEEILGTVPDATIEQVIEQVDRTQVGQETTARCRPQRTQTLPPRFRPQLQFGPVTQAVPYLDPLERLQQDSAASIASAHAALTYSAANALPVVKLHSSGSNGISMTWKPQLDLLNSQDRPEFVLEVEADGRSLVRFGDGQHGARPQSETQFTATYRVGNGSRGNVGADALVHIASTEDGILSVSNPLPATGGVEMETIEEVRQYAPSAFRTQDISNDSRRPVGASLKRAVTPEDYAALSQTYAGVQQASAAVRWTGSWHTVFVSVDRLNGAPVDDAFEQELRQFLSPYRLAGHDLEIDRPRLVALEVTMQVRVLPDYFRSRVRAALLEVFSNRIQPNGQQGVFHPDNFTFGQTVYLSPLYAAAQAIEGVAFVQISQFQRRDRPGLDALDSGKLEFSRFEIPRLDNDPNFPDRGVFRLVLEGGK